jgi:GNAT superfamily N-acetyltransferase
VGLEPTSLHFDTLTPLDIEDVKRLQPEGWPDIISSIEYYFKSRICFPFKAVLNGKVVGIGTAIIHGRTGWLAHIIVDKECRNAGIGTKITQHLIDYIKQTPCETMVLIATALGEPVYKKFGFETETEYVFLENGTLPVVSKPIAVVPFESKYAEAIYNMDRLFYGEDRKILLDDFLLGSQLYVEKNLLKGFYIPALGDGLIEAETPEVGIALMNLRFETQKKFCIPIQNQMGLDYLMKNNFTVNRKAARMILGKKFSWEGAGIYNRIGGNLG